ncbi:HIT domain-containing protein [Glaciecola sp. MF2-115]|uniref:HIT domain-containing protein n=1 Tax=Glaciecola sp. MF2-115 TaxID=3384827 RepID=UPI0039A1A985
MKFNLDERLESDSHFVFALPLSQVRLINDNQFVWCVLIPAVDNAKEIIDLDEGQQKQLWQESATLSRALKEGFTPDKLNVAAIGNIVSQLHVHHICRYKHDIAWPSPVWGKQAMISYTDEDRTVLIVKLQELLREQSEF